MKIFSKKETDQILHAIQNAEHRTSGEIKIHIENRCDADLLERARKVFDMLELHKSAQRNAVLIYIAIIDKKVAIIGDEGINKLVEDNFWEKEIAQLISYFKQNEFKNGIINCLEHVGFKLKSLFPYNSNDINEISDSISFYEN